MLRKLVKYEFREIKDKLPIIIFLYGIYILMTVIMCIFKNSKGDFDDTLITILAVHIIIGSVTPFLIAILFGIKYGRNMYTKRGVFYNMLPVKSEYIIGSKLFAAWICMIIMGIVNYIFVFFDFYMSEGISFDNDYFVKPVIVMFSEIIILLIILAAAILLFLYIIMAMDYLVKINRSIQAIKLIAVIFMQVAVIFCGIVPWQQKRISILESGTYCWDDKIWMTTETEGFIALIVCLIIFGIIQFCMLNRVQKKYCDL